MTPNTYSERLVVTDANGTTTNTAVFHGFERRVGSGRHGGLFADE